MGKNHPQSCNFGITFKLQGNIWSIADNYNISNMCHNGHNITRPEELMFDERETESQTPTDD